MIIIENIHSNIIRVTIPEQLTAQDLKELAPKIDAFIDEHKMIRVLVDARMFNGWKGLSALREHAHFVARHQYYANCIAVIVEKLWQKLLLGTIRVFVKPSMKIFSGEPAAMEWLGRFR